MKKLLFLTLLLSHLFSDTNITEKIEKLDKPLYTPFIERYVLDEIKFLKEELARTKLELNNELARRQISTNDSVVNYATSTINNMFFIIAAATSILVLFGWNSIRDIKSNLKVDLDDKVNVMINDNKRRIKELEFRLEEESAQAIENSKKIAQTNITHSLWMRAGLESTHNAKIEIYDQILSIRPNDAEALSYKADSALEIGEVQWALSLSNQAINIDKEYHYAYYQRACAYSVLGYSDNAIEDLKYAISLNEYYTDEIENESAFNSIRELEEFKAIMSKYGKG